MWKKILSVLCVLAAVSSFAADEPPESGEKVLFENVILNGTVGEGEGSFIWQFSINNRREEAVVRLVSGPVAFSGVPEINCNAPGFWSRRPQAEIIMDGDVPALRIKGKGRIDVKLAFVARAAAAGSHRTLMLDFPDAAGSVSGSICGNGKHISEPEIKNSVAKNADGTVAWDSGRLELAWQVLSEAADTAGESIQRLHGDITVHADTDDLRMNMNVTGNVTSGALNFADWRVPEGWRPVRVDSSAELRDWVFGGENILHLDFAAPVTGEYSVEVEFSGVLAALPGEFTVASPDPGTANFNTRWIFSASPGLVLECLEPGAFIRMADYTAEPRKLISGGKKQFYAAYGTGIPARFRLSLSEPRITHESFVRISLGLDRFAVKGDFKVNVAECGVQKLKVLCDRQWFFQELITGNGERIDVIAEPCHDDPALQYWVLELPHKLLGEMEFSMLWEREPVFDGEFNSGGFTVADSSGRGHAALICDQAVLPGDVKMSGGTEIPADALPVRNSRTVVAGIVRNEPWQITAHPVPAPKKVTGEIFELYVTEEGRGKGMALFTLNCTGAPFEEMLFQFPAGCGNIEFTSSGNVRISGVNDIAGAPDGFIRKRVSFGSRVSGQLTFLASFELPGGAGTPFPIGGISLDGSEISAVFAAAAGSPLMKIADRELAGGIREILPEELPPEYAALAGARILRAWRLDSGAADTVCVFSGERVTGLPAVIENADYLCRLDASGECVLEGRYVIKNSSSQFLRFKLPADAEIWRLVVDGKNIQPFSDGNYTLVALPLPESPLVPVNVELTAAFTADVSRGEAVLPLPVTDMNIVSRRVTVEVPGGGAVPDGRGNPAFIAGGGAWFSPLIIPFLHKLLRVIPFAAGALCAALAAGFAFAYRRKIAGFAGSIVFVGCVLGSIMTVADIVEDGLDVAAPTPVQSIVYESLADFGEADDFVVVKTLAEENSNIFMWSLLSAGGVVVIIGLAAMICRRICSGTVLTGSGVLMLFTAASMTLTGTVWAWVVAAMIVVVILPIAAGIGVGRWKRAAMIVALLSCIAVPAVKAGDFQIKSTEATMEFFADSMKSSWVYEIEAVAGSKAVIAESGTMVFAGDLPAAVTLDKDPGGRWQLVVVENFDGEIELEQISPLRRHGNARSSVLFFPAAVKNTLVLDGKHDVPQVKVDNAVCWNGKTAVMPAGGGTFTVILPDNVAVPESVVPEASRNEKIVFAPGVVHRYTNCRYRSVCHNVDRVKIRPGSGWQVIEVLADGIDHWTVADDGSVTVYFLEPVQGEFNCTVESIMVLADTGEQVCTVVPAEIPGAADNGGIMEFAAADGRRFSVLSADGAVRVAGDGNSNRFRFASGAGTVFTVETATEKAQMRADTNIQMVVAEDRMTLDCDYTFEAVAGEIFEQNIKIPEGFEILSVTSSVPMEWRSDGQYVTIFFEHVLRSAVCTVHCSFAAMGVPQERIVIPDPAPENVIRRTGTVTVTASKGNTLAEVQRKGVSFPEISPDKRRISCRILENGWLLETACTAAKPWISAEQRTIVHLKPNGGEIRSVSDILVENNAVRSLLVQMPAGIADYEFEGRDIARTVDVGKNMVRIEFTRRIEGAYRLLCRMTIPGNEDFTVTPLCFPEASGALSGKLAVTVSEGELLPSVSGGEGITPMEQREFGMIENTGLPLEAWHTSGGNWSLHTAMVRNSGLATSRITLENMNITSVIADTGVEVVHLQADVFSNGAGLLGFRLPAGSTFLAAGFNDVPAVPVYENDGMMLAANDGRSRFFLEYIVRHSVPEAGAEVTFTAPGFSAPVSGICWRIAACGELSGEFVSGTLEPRTITGALLAYDNPVAEPWAIHGSPGIMDQAQLHTLNSNFEKQLFFSVSPGVRSDIYGQMLELNSVSNAGNLAARRRKIAGNLAAGGEIDVDSVAEKIFSAQHNIRTSFPALRASLPVAEKYFLQLEGAMLTKSFAPVEAVVRWQDSLVPAAPVAGWLLVTGIAIITAAALWFAFRRMRRDNV